jgi:beta-xylosidase
MKRSFLVWAVLLAAVVAWAQGDQGNGKYKNPVVFADIPDPDVIRVGDTYYMVSTTMCLLPGATIVKSKDLVNWEYCANPLADLCDKENYSLINGQDAYARGMWACSMKYHNGKFFILLNCNDAGAFVLSASDPEGEWEKKTISRGYYDPGMLFDNGKVYVACGNGNIAVCELDEDFNFIKEKRVISKPDTGLEGCHFYKIGDYYYIYATYGGWPSGQVAFRSTNVFGPYEEMMLVEKYIDGKPNTIHQGSLIDTPDGNEWWTIMQEDKGAMGRMPNLQPVTWVDGWPIVGNNGKPYTTYTKPNVGATYPITVLPTTDSFRSYPLGLQWEWNHTPDNGAWSLFERPGWLRLKTGAPVEKLAQARNMLTQRIYAYTDKVSKGTIRIDVSHLQEGDRAGICVFQDPYAYIAVEKKDGKCRFVWRQDPLRDGQSSETTKELEIKDVVYLRATMNYSDSKTKFYYSLDNKKFGALGDQTTLSFNLNVFVGARFGLFCYATKENEERGYADFDWISTEDKFDEADDDPTTVPAYPEAMLTAEKIELPFENKEVMIGNSGTLPLTATFRDGRIENVASQTSYTISNSSCIKIAQGRLYGLKEGQAQINAVYTDPVGQKFETAFNVRSTFFPFSAQYVKTDFYGNGKYTEETHTFRPSQYGQMGWEYASGADMSDYKYLVIKLAATSSDSHLNIFTENSIWSACHSTADFGSKKQIVVNLNTAKYTSDNKKGQKLDTKNIRIVAFWGMGNKDIKVEDIYLTNNDDYSPTAIKDVNRETITNNLYYDLQGRKVAAPLKKGLYIVNGNKVAIK